MPKYEKARPAHNAIEQSFLDAIARIKAGTPKDPELAKRAKRGTLKISIAVVAQEAGRSRTHISHDNCAYPAVRQEVLKLKSPRTEAPQSMAEINRRLRQENTELRHTVKVARDSMAAMALRMARVVGEAERRIGAAERRSAHRTKAGQVAGQFTDERIASSNDKVVNMKTRKPVGVT